MAEYIITTASGKTFTKDAIYTALDIQTGCKPFNEKKGYFASTLDELRKIVDQEELGYLTAVEAKQPQPFRDDHFHYYTFFLPATEVKPAQSKEKKYRAFRTPEEFKNTLNIKDLEFINFRRNQNNNILHQPNSILHKPYLGYWYCVADNTICFVFGDASIFATDLFDYYEWQDKQGAWHLFGVEIKEK